MTGYFGRNSMMCSHGNEDGKCEECFEVFQETGVMPKPEMTFGEAENPQFHKIKDGVKLGYIDVWMAHNGTGKSNS